MAPCRSFERQKIRNTWITLAPISTHDDTFASHYVLVDPDRPGSPADDDTAILDRDQPLGPRTKSWRLSDAYSRLVNNGDIKREWRRVGIRPMQLSGAWAFAHWQKYGEMSLAADFLRAIAAP